MDEKEINLFDYLLVLARHKKLIFGLGLAGFFLALAIALLLPNIYTATARILPPENTDGVGSMLAEHSALAALAGVSLGGNNTADLYVGMLTSRTISDRIIERFDLMKVYDLDSRTKAREKLGKNVNIIPGRADHIISLSFNDRDPQRAAAIANAYVEELKKLNVQLNLNRAGRERQFLEERLTAVKTDLRNAEDALTQFQKENKAIKLDEQAKSTIDAIARLKGELAKREVDLGVLLSVQTERNPQVQAQRESITQLQEQLRMLEQTPTAQKVSGDIFIPTSEMPDLTVRYARLMRDFKVQEALYEVLTREYEVARVNEARDSSTIQVLDEAVPPDQKSKPRRGLIVLLGTFAFGFGGILLSYFLEWAKKMSPEDLERLKAVKQSLRIRGQN